MNNFVRVIIIIHATIIHGEHNSNSASIIFKVIQFKFNFISNNKIYAITFFYLVVQDS